MNDFMSARAVVAPAELPAGFVLDILTTMDADRWERLSQLFHAASERGPAEREKFLAGACAGDEELRREIESLLSQNISIDGPLEQVARAASAWDTVSDKPSLPRTIGSYRIRGLVGEGGMGAVYEAEQENPHRTVALKVLRSALAAPELLRRFAQESLALGRLQHPAFATLSRPEHSPSSAATLANCRSDDLRSAESLYSTGRADIARSFRRKPRFSSCRPK